MGSGADYEIIVIVIRPPFTVHIHQSISVSRAFMNGPLSAVVSVHVTLSLRGKITK